MTTTRNIEAGAQYGYDQQMAGIGAYIEQGGYSDADRTRFAEVLMAELEREVA